MARGKGGEYPGDHRCAHPGCGEPAPYRAPVDRPGSRYAPPSGPPQWQYFCLEHIRAFNAGWNYFEGMDADAIFQAQTPYPQWDRETRRFAHRSFNAALDRAEEALSTLRWRAAQTANPAPSALSAQDRAALGKLGLAEGATLSDAKKQYRTLARRYHPDTNGGDRSHESQLQAVTDAIDHLSRSESFRRDIER